MIVYKQENPDATEEELAKQRNKSRLQIKRAQAKEAGDVSAATTEGKLKTKLKYISNIEYAAEEGKMLAQIKNNADLIESKGEVTPVQKKSNATKRISGVLAEMSDHYSSLNAKKAIVNVDNTVAENAMASLSASGLGQFTQKILGTESQSLRNSIKNKQPLLINYIRQASEMGSRGLDSEKELEFYLRAATDPTIDVQSNIAAMVILDNAYGTGELNDVFWKTLDPKLLRRMKQDGAKINKADKNKGSDPSTWSVLNDSTGGQNITDDKDPLGIR